MKAMEIIKSLSGVSTQKPAIRFRRVVKNVDTIGTANADCGSHCNCGGSTHCK